MAAQSKLNPDQWRQARQRWEGSADHGFEWLRREMQAAFGVSPSRQGIAKTAREQGWEKGGEPKPPLHEGTEKVAQPSGKVAQPSQPAAAPEVADEVVPPAAPAPTWRPPGRPTLYRPEFADRLMEFFTKEPYTTVDVTQPSGMVKKQRMATDPPMLQDFAESIGVSKTTVDNWATALKPDGSPLHPEFFAAYARARERQESLFARAGMLGLYDTRFLAMVMKNLCGWQDQPAPKVDHAAVSKEELDRRFGQRVEAARQRQMEVLEERRRLRRLAEEAAGLGAEDALALPGIEPGPEAGDQAPPEPQPEEASQ